MRQQENFSTTLSELRDVRRVISRQTSRAIPPKQGANLRRRDLRANHSEKSRSHRAAENPHAWDHVCQYSPYEALHAVVNQLSCAVHCILSNSYGIGLWEEGGVLICYFSRLIIDHKSSPRLITPPTSCREAVRRE